MCGEGGAGGKGNAVGGTGDRAGSTKPPHLDFCTHCREQGCSRARPDPGRSCLHDPVGGTQHKRNAMTPWPPRFGVVTVVRSCGPCCCWVGRGHHGGMVLPPMLASVHWATGAASAQSRSSCSPAPCAPCGGRNLEGAHATLPYCLYPLPAPIALPGGSCRSYSPHHCLATTCMCGPVYGCSTSCPCVFLLPALNSSS